MRIILVRHGQTAWNKKNIFRGRVDISLDNTGRQQAQAIAERLSASNIDSIYSSPLKRALETTRIIKAKLKIDGAIDDDLTDIDFGGWEGLSFEAVEEQYPELYGLWLTDPHKVKIPDGEDLASVRNRASKVLNRVLKSERGVIAVVSHRVILKTFICAALSLDNSYFWQIKQDVGAISILDYQNERFTLSVLNDTCHIDKAKHAKESKDF
jgi:broad specificity phosphatase PhoE